MPDPSLVCFCQTGDHHIRQSVLAGEEAALFRRGEPWVQFRRPCKCQR